ncbi:chemotaxis protein CheW [Aurantivibrio plasticivorans]
MSLRNEQQSSQKLMLAYLNDLLNREHTSTTPSEQPVVKNNDVSASAELLEPVRRSPVMLSPSILEVVPVAEGDAVTQRTIAEAEPNVVAPEHSEQDLKTDLNSPLTDDNFQAVEFEASHWHENGRPSWAQDAFDILLFKVNGMTLAVPLISLGQIYEITDALSPLFGQAPWFVGIQPTPMGKINVINTAQYVMPERYHEETAQKPDYIMTIDRLHWGLTVNSVDQPIRIQVDDVKWRRDRSQQPWLAGIVKNHMCVLVDVPTLGRALLDSDVS